MSCIQAHDNITVVIHLRASVNNISRIDISSNSSCWYAARVLPATLPASSAIWAVFHCQGASHLILDPPVQSFPRAKPPTCRLTPPNNPIYRPNIRTPHTIPLKGLATRLHVSPTPCQLPFHVRLHLFASMLHGECGRHVRMVLLLHLVCVQCH